MASFCRSAARLVAAALRNELPSLSKPLCRAPPPSSRPVHAALGCAGSYTPVHSIVTAARLRSCVAVDTSCWFWTARGSSPSWTPNYKRETHSKAKHSTVVGESCPHEPSPPSSSSEALSADDEAPIPKYKVLSQLKASDRHDLAMVFTCRVCETRSIKTTCCESYEKGIVIARCDGCNNLHLMADRLGWFGEPGSVEDLLAARGEDVKKWSTDTLNFTVEDLAGRRS